MLTYDTKGVWRCFEIKASKDDFYSDARWTFVGHYNYFVMTSELYEEVKDDIPKHVGVHTGFQSLKRASRQELAVDEQVLKDSLIRSLSREVQKLYRSNSDELMNRLERQNSRYLAELRELRKYKVVLNSLTSMVRRGRDMEDIKDMLAIK